MAQRAASISPWAATCPDFAADQGQHSFTYAFTAWEGPFIDAPVVQEAYALNVMPLVTPGTGPDFSAFVVDEPNVFIDVVKRAEDRSGDLILRLYEAKKADTTATLAINIPVKEVQLCDMLENPTETLKVEDGCVQLHFGTFQVKTLRLKL